MNTKLLRTYFPVVFIVLLAAVLRFLWIDKIPNAIGGDELTYIINAKFVWLTGSDISGTWNPVTAFIFKYPAYTVPQAELPYILLAPLVGPFSFSLFAARFGYVIFSILTVLLIYLITKELFGREVGFISGLVASFNPWLIYIGRTNYEASPMVFFFLTAIFILLKAKNNQILWSIPVLFLGFYSYIGTKLSFIPFVLVVCIFSYFLNKRKFLKQYAIVFLSSFFLVLFFISSLHAGQSRIGEIFLPNDPQLTKQVDEIRRVSIQTPLTNIFENKYTIYSRTLITKLFKSLSADYLFVSGDNFFSIIRNGMFYVIDAFFIILGLAKIYEKKKSIFWFLLGLILISTIPQLFHTASIDNFVFHLSLMFPFFIIIIAVGIWEILNLFRNKRYFYASSVILILLYGFVIFNFLNIYFFQWPLRGNFDFNVRLLSKYTSIASSQNKKIDVYSHSSSDIFKKYLFYSNNINKNNLSQIRKDFKKDEFDFENISFIGCNNTIDPRKTKDIIIYDFSCGKLSKDYSHVSIPRLYDGGQSYLILNDDVCSNFSLKPYPSNVKISDFSIENMSVKQFCQTYVTNL